MLKTLHLGHTPINYSSRLILYVLSNLLYSSSACSVNHK